MDVDRSMDRVRELLHSGDELGARALLREARAQARDDGERLFVDVHAVSFRLATAELAPAATSTDAAWRALEGGAGEGLDPLVRRRLALELRITDAVRAGDDADLDDAVRESLRLLPLLPSSLPTAARAANNRLSARIDRLEAVGLGPGEPGHVDALLAIGEARSLADQLGRRGTIDRRSIDVAITIGDWNRAWEWTHHALETRRLLHSERVGISLDAAQLALERGMLREARELGAAAQSLAVGRSELATRRWGAMGGVVAAAAGGGSMEAALRGLARAVPSGRAVPRLMRAGLLALEAGMPLAEVHAALARVFGADRSAWPQPWAALLEATAAPSPWSRVAALDAWCDGPAPAHLRGAALRLRAIARMREGAPAAAAADLARGLRLLWMWEGPRRDALVRLREELLPRRPVTPAQSAVLELVVEGRTDREIAAALGRSARTVESHVRALLRVYEAPNRVGLAVAAAREPYLDR